MGLEYKIGFAVPTTFSTAALAERMPDPSVPGSSWSAYEWRLEAYGFYFLDNGRSVAASVAFRALVDEALRAAAHVTIEEL